MNLNTEVRLYKL